MCLYISVWKYTVLCMLLSAFATLITVFDVTLRNTLLISISFDLYSSNKTEILMKLFISFVYCLYCPLITVFDVTLRNTLLISISFDLYSSNKTEILMKLFISFVYTNLYSQINCINHYSARFSQKVVSGKKPPTSKNLAAHLEILPLTPKKFSGKNCHQYLKI